jgi:hypothetical protein
MLDAALASPGMQYPGFSCVTHRRARSGIRFS